VFAVLAAAIGGLMLMIGCAFLYYRLEWKALILCAALPAVTVAATGRISDMPLMVAPVLMGCLGGFTFKKGKSLEFFLITASVSMALIFTAVFYYLMLYENVDFIGMLRIEMVKILGATGAPEDIKAEMLAEFDGSRNDMIARVPFSAFAYSLAMAGIGFAIIRRFFGRMMGIVPGAGLEMFRLHDFFIFVLIAGLALFLLIDKSNYPVLHSAGLNIALVAALLYFTQALGVVKFLLMRRGVPGYVLPLAVAGMLIMGMWVAMFMLVMLSGVGALDVWADFRKLAHKGDAEK
ncbi:MAG TPA: DUF2232 domain-containing protein, partial [Spirochaetota bacterium]|nr:DUF2232 domain-containing protein [Spirochaetota bacterium]